MGKYTHIHLGSGVNVDALTARLPDAKICGARDVLIGPISNPGNRIVQAEISKSYDD